jgi:hypothetical protein
MTAHQEKAMKVASYLSPKTSVKPSGIAGRGLYANATLVREIVSVKGGHLIDRATLERHTAVVNDADMQIADDLFLAPLTADEFEGVMMFLDHSCEPNVGVQGQIVFVSLRDVAAGEELTIDYGTINHDTEPMACRCGTASCRGTITGEDWRRHDLQLKFGDHFAWHLLRRMRSER